MKLTRLLAWEVVAVHGLTGAPFAAIQAILLPTRVSDTGGSLYWCCRSRSSPGWGGRMRDGSSRAGRQT